MFLQGGCFCALEIFQGKERKKVVLIASGIPGGGAQ